MPGTPGHIEQSLPPWLQPYYEGLAKESESLRREAPHRYPRSPEQRIAGLTPDILHAQQLVREKTGTYAPYLKRSAEMTQGATRSFPESYEKYLNPYMSAVVNRIGEEGGRTFKERILPELEARFVKLGQHGGSRHAKMTKEAARDLQNEIMAKQQQALASGYQQAAQMYNADMTRSLEAAKEMATLGGLGQAANLADIQALMEQGRYQQAQNQAVEDLRHQEFLQQQQEPYQKLAQHAGILTGVPTPMSSSYMQQPVMPPSQMNLAGRLGEAALGMWGLRQAMGRRRGGYIRGY